ncbi:MAG: hypothetical protein LBP88_05455 [Treponema sp.]|jgi:hypothetical protein|nr:hypothetical protein [Treponema sp.]
MTKKIRRLWAVLAGAGILSCTSPLEQMPEKVVVTADPAIRLPLGDPLKGESSLGEQLKTALNIDPGSTGLTSLYDYVDPEARQDRKFFLYQTLFKQEIKLEEYKKALGSKDIAGMPNAVKFKDKLPSGKSPPYSLTPALEIPINGTITITNDKIKGISGNRAGLKLICSRFGKTRPDSITVHSEVLNFTKTKEAGEVKFGQAMVFTGDDEFVLTPESGKIKIDFAITMTFTEIADDKDIGITPEFIFEWTEAELDLADLISSADLQGSYPAEGEESINLASLQASLFGGKLAFKEIPFFVYVNGPKPWFEEENIKMLSLKAVTGGSTETSLYDGPISPASLPRIHLSGQGYAPKTGVARLPSSVSADLAEVFNAYPEALTFDYSITVERYIITPAMLQGDALAFEGAIAFILPLHFTATEEIDLAEDVGGFEPPGFGEEDLLGREDAGADSQVFDFIRGIRLDLEVYNSLGLDGEIKLYANDAKEDLLNTLSLQGSSSVDLTKERLRGIYPFAPAFDIIIPQDTELRIKRSVSDNPFGLNLSIRLDGSITQEISL